MAARICVIGEALVDVITDPDGASTEVPGGSPANVALAMGRLGHTPMLVTTLGADPRGRAVQEWLEASQVKVIANPAGRTSTALATLDATGAADYRFDLTWNPDPAVAALAAGNCEVLHSGSIATVLEPGGTLVEALFESAGDRALLSLDPNARPAITPDVTAARARVEQLVALAHVVKVSDEDLGWYYPEEYPLDAAVRWATLGPRMVVVTRGAEGAVAFRAPLSTEPIEPPPVEPAESPLVEEPAKQASRNQAALSLSKGQDQGSKPAQELGPTMIEIPGVATEVVDTVGAGDTFEAALLDGLVRFGAVGPLAGERLAALSDDEIRLVLSRAARAAAITVSRRGCDPPTAAELDA
ncbi:MAG: carbohydrate kinase [Promicromonosporaceae bacterium]|nr:carbohydrate kinase [Promicromonosporaceae bacterium]